MTPETATEIARLDALSRARALTMEESLRLERLVMRHAPITKDGRPRAKRPKRQRRKP